jgi:hypothetical protein
MIWKSALLLIFVATSMPMQAAGQPNVQARKAPIITKDGLQFRDLDKNGLLDRIHRTERGDPAGRPHRWWAIRPWPQRSGGLRA